MTDTATSEGATTDSVRTDPATTDSVTTNPATTDPAPTPQPPTPPAANWRRGKAPAAPPPRAILQSTVVAVASLLALVAVGKLTHSTLLTPPLAATAAILAGAPTTPPAQPRSVFGGHLLSALLGILVVAALGSSPWTIALAGGLSLPLMACARAVHAPAAATAALIVAQHPPILRTTGSLLAGCALLVLIACVTGLIVRAARYPRYWW